MNLLPFVTLARDENPKPLLTADEVAMCLYRAASLAQAAGHDVGVLLKPHGAGGMSPVGRISLDILIDIQDEQEYDAFSSADGPDHSPGPAIPTWRKLPFKVGVPPSGASMDRVRRPIGSVPVPTPEPAPQKPDEQSPEKPALCQCAEVVEMLTKMRLDDEARFDAIITALRTLHDDNRLPRRVQVSGWRTGTLTGRVEGMER